MSRVLFRNVSGLVILAALVYAGCVSRPARQNFSAIGSLPARAEMPDPLTRLDGKKVASRSEWFRQRRPELKALFEHYMYGPIPPRPKDAHFETVGEYPDFLEGQATLKLITIVTGNEGAPRIDLMLVLPNARRGPAPVILAMDFCGNHSLTADPRVPMSRSWMGKNCKGCENNIATEASRGSAATNWPFAEIVRRGYGVAAFYSGDVDPDNAKESTGIYRWLASVGWRPNTASDRGTIAAWAWGFHRCVDYLVTDRAVDRHRIASLGHSRNGKTALLAAAFDERISLAFAHQAGCGGSAPSRGKTGESLTAINKSFPHWFNGAFKEFNESPEKLPFDQNCLVALCAPRPVLFSAAQEDQWANPPGQFEVLRAATPTYHFLGAEGLAADSFPPIGQLIDSRLGFYIREGKHSMTVEDWKIFLDYADKQWGKSKIIRN